MSTTNKKRPVEAPTAPVAKRTAMGKKTDLEVVDLDKEETYAMTVTLQSSFNVFPVPLRTKLEAMYTRCIRDQMKSPEAITISKDKWRFSVISDLRVRDTIIKTKSSLHKNNITSASLANTVLLDTFVKSKSPYLICSKPSFIILPTEVGLTNPEFTQLHSVRRNGIGWGFDTNDCLSLHVVFVENAKKHEYTIFVQRTEVKVEEQD